MAEQVRGQRVHERWARFRFSVIGQLLASPPPKGELNKEIEALAERQWRHPITGEGVRFAFSTIERWFYNAVKRDDPVAVLRRKLRADAGQQPAISSTARQIIPTNMPRTRVGACSCITTISSRLPKPIPICIRCRPTLLCVGSSRPMAWSSGGASHRTGQRARNVPRPG